VAFKKIKYFDLEKDELLVPTKENGYKFEIFIFDSYPFAERFSLLEVDRDEEFAPVKNAPGSETCAPEHARDQISKLHRKWLENCGLKFEGIYNMNLEEKKINNSF
jgi:UDP-N-acetylglucosamine/UDP-N-acetylgalactosamine diphosphorylase